MLYDDEDCDLEPCISHDWSVVDSDGRQVCGNCGFVMPRYMDPDDCLDCGVCEECIDRTIDAMGDE